MLHRLAFAAALPIVALAGTASAQPAYGYGPPGDCDCAPPAAPAYGYGPAVPIVVPQSPDLVHRLGVGLHGMGLAIANREDPDADPTQLGGGGLQVRYRLTRRWELELGIGALQQHDEETGEPIGSVFHTATLGALFHMRPGHHWDWYLVGALGAMHEGEHDDDHDTRDARPMAQLGIGVQYRWTHLAIGADFRAVGIGPLEKDAAEPGAPTTQGKIGGGSTSDDEGDAGGQFTLAATYYF
jgi:hypothetical protein